MFAYTAKFVAELQESKQKLQSEHTRIDQEIENCKHQLAKYGSQIRKLEHELKMEIDEPQRKQDDAFLKVTDQTSHKHQWDELSDGNSLSIGLSLNSNQLIISHLYLT